MGIGKDENSPAHQYADAWRAKRRLKMRTAMAWAIQIKEPKELSDKFINFLCEEFPQYFEIKNNILKSL